MREKASSSQLKQSLNDVKASASDLRQSLIDAENSSAQKNAEIAHTQTYAEQMLAFESNAMNQKWSDATAAYYDIKE
eukprot:12407078-Karenia_brevis.AAC.1